MNATLPSVALLRSPNPQLVTSCLDSPKFPSLPWLTVHPWPSASLYSFIILSSILPCKRPIEGDTSKNSLIFFVFCHTASTRSVPNLQTYFPSLDSSANTALLITLNWQSWSYSPTTQAYILSQFIQNYTRTPYCLIRLTSRVAHLLHTTSHIDMHNIPSLVLLQNRPFRSYMKMQLRLRT